MGITTFGKRLDLMLRDTEMEKTTLANMLGIHRSTVHWWLHDRNVPRGRSIDQIIDIFSEYNSKWIETGIGEIYKSGRPGEVNHKIEELENRLKDKDQIIKLLQEKLELLTK